MAMEFELLMANWFQNIDGNKCSKYTPF